MIFLSEGSNMAMPSDVPSRWSDPRWARFSLIHVVVFLACWIPLNPIVIESVRNPQFSLDSSSLVGILCAIFGPFAPRVFNRTATLHPELIFVAAVVLTSGILVQLAWRPSSLRFEVVRQLAWAAGWWVWFCSAFVSLVANI